MSAKNVSPKAKVRAPRARKSEKVAKKPSAAVAAQVDVAEVAASAGTAVRPPLLERAVAARAKRVRTPRPPKRTGSEAQAEAAVEVSEVEPPIDEIVVSAPPAREDVVDLTEPSIERNSTSAGVQGEKPLEAGDAAGVRRRPRGRRGGRGRGRDRNERPGARVEGPRPLPSARDLDDRSVTDPATIDSLAIEDRETDERGPADGGIAAPGDRAGEQDDRLAGRRRRGRRGRGWTRRDEERPTDGRRDSRDDVEPDDRGEAEEIVVDHSDDDAPIPDGAAREMMINVSAGEECRIAILQDGRLEELFIERTASQSHVGNIYKGRVTNVEPSIQAAFIDFGLPKNGFLHVSDVQPQYFPQAGESEDVGRKIPRHHRPPIQKCFRRGQEVIVQITKEGVGTKGPTLTTYLSIPGRFLVMMPGMSEVGVSRKIDDEVLRRRMRDMLAELDLPPGMGFILRTAGMDRNKRELQRDLHYLQRLWRTVVERVKQNPAPAELYRESDLVIRSIRDVYSADFKRVVVDDAVTAERVREFLQIAMPRARSLVEHYTRREPLFHHFGIEAEIERINSRHVPLKSGGSLVIDSTEAMVAIDVNSGRFRALDDAEETAFKINVEAAEEIARQLRLRDLGGLIVCDFIDMRLDRHKRAVERALRDALRKHKERARLLRMSAFGLIEMTRQRQGPSLKRNTYFDCPHCRGTGLVKMPESVILDVIRIIQLAAHHDHVRKITVSVAGDVAYRILNKKRALLSQIEAETAKTVVIRGDANFTSDQIEFVCEDERGQLVPLGSAIQHEPQRSLPREPVVAAS